MDAYSADPPAPKRKSRTWVWALAAVLGAIAFCALGAAIMSNPATNPDKPKHTATPSVSLPSDACGGGLCAVSGAKKPSPTPTPTMTSADTQVFLAGTYEVGAKSDPAAGTIKPGTFILTSTGHCYWERLRGFGGELDDIISNGNLDATDDKQGQARLTIKKGDKGVNLSGDCILSQKGGLK